MPVHGWLMLDKPDGMTSTHAVSASCRRIFNAQKAGHAGTLDPLASGILPLALGEATKTVPLRSWRRGRTYVFTIRWGQSTDHAGPRRRGHRNVSDVRPTRRGHPKPLLPTFIGEIDQVPPQFSRRQG
jgi:tRNA pseudouridine55 synthase